VCENNFKQVQIKEMELCKLYYSRNSEFMTMRMCNSTLGFRACHWEY